VHAPRHPVLPQPRPAREPDPRVERPGLAARLADAADRLHATDNFPEFTRRLCPAPREAACVLKINSDPVTIKQVGMQIIDRAFASRCVVPLHPSSPPSPRVGVIGSGPAALAAAQQPTRAGRKR
jgi:glutamate synthase (NADPH) small chain